MRNLLGRLNARSPEELSRIAIAWRVPVSGGDKLGQVAQLYRSLADPRAARDLWSRLPDEERTLIRLLAVGDDAARPLAELAEALGLSALDVREIATRLYHKGIIVREGDDDPLPVGEAPRLFLPRELALLFRRIQEEISLGDLSEEPLQTLLARRDDREIEEAAEHWGIRVIPGLRPRGELILQILQNIGDPQRLSNIQTHLKRDAAQIWQRLRDAGDGKPVPTSEAASAAGLNSDEPRQVQRFRQALAELEAMLLVWHTYKADGSRWLFVPQEISSPRAHSVEEKPKPKPVESVSTQTSNFSPYAVAWDLLTLLRALSPPQDQRILDFDEAPPRWLQWLNQMLWNRGADTPPSGYLEFLVDLARVEGVLTGGDPAVDEPFQVSPVVRTWRDRSFPEQTSRLRSTWLSSSAWIEGSSRDDVEVWGADWPGFRFKLLAHLAVLERSATYELEEVATWLAERDPNMLGATSQVATARNLDLATGEEANRRAEIAEVATVALATAFAWFGLVELIRIPRKPLLVRLTPAGAALAHTEPAPEEPAGAGPAIRVEPNGEIHLVQPSPLRVWSVSAFSDLVELGSESRYQVTERSITRALRAGFEIRHVEAFLSNQSGSAIPGVLLDSIRGWSQSVRRVRLSRMVRLVPDDAGQLVELRDAFEKSGLVVTVANDALLVEIEDVAELTRAESAVLKLLREMGFTPRGLAVGTTMSVARKKHTDLRSQQR